MSQFKWIIIGLFGLSLFGCQTTDNQSSSQKEEAIPLSETQQGTLSFNITPTALLWQTLDRSERQRLMIAADAADVFSGTMTATRTDIPSAPEDFGWHITVEANFTTQSNKTIVLTPGTYDFELEVERGNQKYLGEALAIDIADGTNDVPMTLRPMIGLTTIDIDVNETAISQFRFQYDPNELNLANFTTPRIGIIVDGGNELIFALNMDGVSDVLEDAMVGLLPAGDRNIQLRLYDANVLRGKSIEAQEDQTIVPGNDIRMDLVALHGELTFNLTEEGGDATFNINFPQEVFDEVGGASNLQVIFKTANSALNNDFQQVVDLNTNQVTIPNFQFDTLDITLEFEDTSTNPSEIIGSCLMPGVALTKDAQTLTCNLTLIRRAIVGGKLLAVIGINVFDEDNLPVAGANVMTTTGEFIGITGDGSFGTAGYVKGFLEADTHTIQATKGSLEGEVVVEATVLGIHNADITLSSANLVGPFRAVGAGLMHMCAILVNGTAQCWGDGNNGQLGDGNANTSFTPVPVMGLADVVQIDGGNAYSCALLGNGTVKCWGMGNNGVLGNGGNGSSNVPVDVLNLSDAIQISTLNTHTCAVVEDGRIFCWGDGAEGQNGNGGTETKTTPAQVSNINNAVQVAAGGNHGCALLDDGTMRCWGRGSVGALGTGQQTQHNTPVPVVGISNAVQITAGVDHTCAVLSDSTVQCWGNSTASGGSGLVLLPIPIEEITNAVQVVGGAQHTCVLLSTGKVMCWGAGGDGELGDGLGQSSDVPVEVFGITNATQIATEGHSTCATLRDGRILCWGRNATGQLGNGTSSPEELIPVEVAGPSIPDWTPLNSGVAVDLTGLSIVDENLIYASGQNGTILRTIDGGNTWTPQDPGTSEFITAIDFHDANLGVASATIDTVLQTTDGGDTWVERDAISRILGQNFNDITLVNANVGYLVGSNNFMFKTTDGGTTWNALPETGGTLSEVQFIDENIGMIATRNGCCPEGMIITTNGGANWSLKEAPTQSIIHSLSFIDEEIGYLAGKAGLLDNGQINESNDPTAQGTILKTTDGGDNWTIQNSNTSQTLFDIQFINSNEGFAVGNFGTILRTVDGGNNWFAMNSGTTEHLFEIRFLNEAIGYIVGANGTILTTSLVQPINPVSWPGTISSTIGNDEVRDMAIDSEGNVYLTGTTDGDLGNNQSDVNAGESDIFVVKYNANGVRQWARLLGSAGDDKAFGIAVSDLGYVYITGFSGGTIDGVTNVGGADVITAQYDFDGNLNWFRKEGSLLPEQGEGVAVDSQGNAYIVGTTSGDLFGSSAGQRDYFIAKYTPGGDRPTLGGAVIVGTPFDDAGNAITIDSNDNIYITGSTFGDLDGNTSAGGEDVFVARYETNLDNRVWIRQFGSTVSESGVAITTDLNGGIYISGDTNAPAGGGVSQLDVLLAHYDADGSLQYTRQFGSDQRDLGRDLLVTSSGDIYITGFARGDLIPGSSAPTEFFLTHHDALGNLLESFQQSGPTSGGFGMVINSQQELIITGNTAGALPGDLQDFEIVKLNLNLERF